MTYESDIAGLTNVKPETFELGAVFPNPTNGVAVISFHLPKPEQVNIVVVDQTGRKVMELVNGSYPAGSHRYTLTADELPSGIYFIRLTTSSRIHTRKFVLLK